MRIFILFLISCFVYSPAFAQSQYGSVYLEDFTWPELRDKMNAGTRTVIIPIGGTEQNGPHLALGKHNAIVAFNAGEIARELSNAVVAPVITYVPEGRINPPEGHMRFPGTISVREETLAALLEDAARSFKQHGFMTICFIGDHGGSQVVQQRVADKLTAEWKTERIQVLHVDQYYGTQETVEWAAKNYPNLRDPAGHAGFFDTAELLATDKRMVRQALVKAYDAKDYGSYGVKGNPMGADESAGVKLLNMRSKAAVRQIRALTASR